MAKPSSMANRMRSHHDLFAAEHILRRTSPHEEDEDALLLHPSQLQEEDEEEEEEEEEEKQEHMQEQEQHATAEAIGNGPVGGPQLAFDTASGQLQQMQPMQQMQQHVSPVTCRNPQP